MLILFRLFENPAARFGRLVVLFYRIVISVCAANAPFEYLRLACIVFSPLVLTNTLSIVITKRLALVTLIEDTVMFVLCPYPQFGESGNLSPTFREDKVIVFMFDLFDLSKIVPFSILSPFQLKYFILFL
jgi:hypothetical protein